MVRRLSGDIDAEAECIEQEASVLIAALAAKKDAAKQIFDQNSHNSDMAIAKATTALTEAQKARTKAKKVPPDLDGAEINCRQASIAANNAAELAGQDTEGKAATLKEEWKECRASIDRFDKLLVDLRKTGIGFVTTIIGGAAFLLSHSGTQASSGGTAVAGGSQGVAAPAQTSLVEAVPAVKVSIFFVIALLILGLYTIDRAHQIWLRTSVDRAIALEPFLGFQLTQQISKSFRGVQASFIGVGLYVLFLATAAFVFVMALEPSAKFHVTFTAEQYYIIFIAATSFAIMMIYLYITRRE
jgi:hypothetical protein